MRKELFEKLCIGLAVAILFSMVGHFLKPWAVGQIIAGIYVIGVVVIFLKTK